MTVKLATWWPVLHGNAIGAEKRRDASPRLGLALAPAHPGLEEQAAARDWIEVDPQLVGMLQILGTYGVRMQLEAREVGEPGECRGIAWHDLLR